MISLYKRLSVLGIAALSLIVAPDPACAGNVTFHFYGAHDCPPCMAFKRDGLPLVRYSASENGYNISENLIARTIDVPRHGSFGENDAQLREAASALDQVYPPIFFVTRDELLVSVYGDDWRAAMARAEAEATQSE